MGWSGLLALWTGMTARASPPLRRWALRTAAFAALAAPLVWWLYYRDVWDVTHATLQTVGAQAASAPDHFFRVRWIHLWKMAQNLLLKFGGGPVVLAWVGLRDREAPESLRRLLWAWLACGAAQALLALVTPFAFRFEFFLTPAVAMAAGLGAVRLRERGHGRAVAVIWGMAMILQLTIGVFHWAGAFKPISVIIPSPRWLWPFGR